jgi:ABC-type proline/glycine betaine transport system ATPase subunit
MNLPLVKFSMIMILPRNKQRIIETRRTEMSMVFQSLVSCHRTILENAAEIRGEAKEQRDEKALQALETGIERL